MTIKIIKAYSLKYKYYNFNLLPVIVYSGFHPGDKSVFIGWLFWGIQFEWNKYTIKSK